VGKLKEIEHEADHITHQVYKRMHKVFLTPLDREDIYLLANKMDSILDEVESAAVRMYLYRMKVPTQELVKITEILSEAVGKIRRVVFSVRKKQDAAMIIALCVEINTLENEADQLHRAAMVRLFEEEKDAIELIKVKDIIGR
jgi:predicted phosphate transport protein (TIGR00153 family)